MTLHLIRAMLLNVFVASLFGVALFRRSLICPVQGTDSFDGN